MLDLAAALGVLTKTTIERKMLRWVAVSVSTTGFWLIIRITWGQLGGG